MFKCFGFFTFGPTLHDVPQDTVARAAHREPPYQLEPQRLGLRDSAQTPICNFLTVQNDRVFGEVEPFLHYRGQLADATVFLAQNSVGTGGHDDDFGTSWGDSHFHP